MKKILSFLPIFWLAGCSSAPVVPPETVTTWIVTPTGLRHHTSAEDQTQAFLDSIGYRCYSPEDDLAWRDRMSLLESQ